MPGRTSPAAVLTVVRESGYATHGVRQAVAPPLLGTLAPVGRGPFSDVATREMGMTALVLLTVALVVPTAFLLLLMCLGRPLKN